MRFVTLVFVGWMLLCACLAAEVESKSDLVDKLSSPNLADRLEAVQSLQAEKIGSLEPEFAIRAVLVAAQDPHPRVRTMALGGLGLLSAALPTADTNPQAAAFAQAIHAARELRPMLERIITEDPSMDVVIAASTPFMALYGSDPAAEALLLDRADKLRPPIERATLMMELAIGGLDAEATVQRLNRYFDDAPLPVQHRAAEILVWTDRLSPDRLDDFLRVIETHQYFADPTLVRALPRFGASPDKYLARLLAMQSRLEEELRKPRDQRTVTVYNDAYWKRTLDEAIALARKRVGAVPR